MQLQLRHKSYCFILFSVFLLSCFTSFPAYAETVTVYNYDEVGNMISKISTDSGNLDNDGDGLSNAEEERIGTDPNNNDTDGDGMPDGWEVANGLDPLYNNANDDTDNDGVSNYDEYLAGTNPNIPYDLILVNDTISTGTVNYQAENSIISGPAFIVESVANVTFKAGNIITLKPGFTASEGSIFHAAIE